MIFKACLIEIAVCPLPPWVNLYLVGYPRTIFQWKSQQDKLPCQQEGESQEQDVAVQITMLRNYQYLSKQVAELVHLQAR